MTAIKSNRRKLAAIAFLFVGVCFSLGISTSAQAQAPPDIEVWYGLSQEFGSVGNPQRYIDILGKVSATGLQSLTYSLNGAPDSSLSVGPDGRRLESEGDFCIDINTADLIDGTNTIVITATDNVPNVSSETVTVEYDAGNVWPLPYTIDWNSAADIPDVSDVVDGLWELGSDAVRTTITGYDRLIAIGDTTWQDYDVTVPITIHSMDPNGGIGLLLRWTGHTDEPPSAADMQPKSGWLPLGAILRYKVGNLDIYANGTSVATTPMTLDIDSTYIFRARVETVPGLGGLYSFKVWKQGTAEPTSWDLTAQEDFSDPQYGSLLLFAHLGDASFGDVDIQPLFINDIEIVAEETTAEVTWTTSEPATSSVAYGPTIAYEDGSVTETSFVTDHSITLTGLSENTTYHCQITSDDGLGTLHTSKDLTFATLGSSGIESDDFNAATLNTSIWTYIDPLGGDTLSMTGTGTPDAWAEISVLGGIEHKVTATSNDVPRLMQSANDVNFEVEVKFESLLDSRYQSEGVFVEESASDFIRFEFYHNGTSTYYFAATYEAFSRTTQHSGSIPDGAPLYMQVLREGDQWTQSYSNDGASWTPCGSFEHEMTVTSIGPFIGNSGTSAPAYVGQIDYFFNTDSPIDPEDDAGANTAPELALIGDQYVDEGSTLAVPISATDDDGDDIILEGTGLPPFVTLYDYGDGTGQLDIEPGPGDAGEYPVTITASDDPGGLTDDETFTIYIREITPPTVVVTAPPSGETHETLPTLTIDFDDNIGIDRGYYQVDGCEGAWTELWAYNSLSADTTIDWSPSLPEGTYDIFFKVVDDAGNVNTDSCTYSWSFTYEISAVPVIISTAPTTGTVGELYSYDVEATGDPAPEYTLTEWPGDMEVDEITGLIEWTPTAAGDFDVTVEANNTAGTDTQEFTITVSEPPDCPPELTHYWKLNEAAGPPYEDYVGSADGVCSDCPGSTGGLLGGAQLFDGDNDEVGVPDDDSFDWDATSSFSIAYWMNTTASLSEIKAVVGRNDGSSGLRWWLGLDDDGTVRFQLRDTDGNGPYLGGIGDALTDGDWHLVVGVKDESVDRVRIYVDGLAVDSADHDFTAGFGSDVDVTFGYLDLNTHYRFPGTIDEIATFNKALTETEIQTFHAAGLAGLGYCDEGGVAPTIISTPITDATVGVAYVYDVNATGYPVAEYALLTSPIGMTIDPATGLIEWTPVPGDEGPHAVEVEAGNTEGTTTQDFTLTVVEPTPPDLVVWYGFDQQFGHIGSPQRTVDILGNVSDADSVASVVYSLNGSPDSAISIGPDGRRLESEGDFNMEINTLDLIDGTNEVVITATDNLANETVDTVTLEYNDGNIWPLPYGITWSSVTNIQDVAQVVDGMWGLESTSIRTTIPGYDRLVAIGDTTWINYEVIVPMTIHTMNSSTSVGVLLRWHGHTEDPVSGWQPKSGWFPLGAIMRCRDDGMDIYGNQGTIIASNSKVLSTGVPYTLRARVETVAGEGDRYSFKVWETVLAEPDDWDLSGQATIAEPANGSMMLFAHQGDVSFGDVTINPLMISDIEVVAGEEQATITWTTDEPATSNVAYGLTDTYELGNVSDGSLVTSHSITLTGLTENTLYHFQITSEIAGGTPYSSLDMTFQTAMSSGIVSDDFNAAVLNTTLWSFVDPLSDDTLGMVGTHTQDAWARIAIPSGTAHRVWASGNESPRLMQSANNVDFEVEVKFESAMSEQYQLQGIFIEEDSDDLIRFEFYHDGTSTYAYASSYVALSGTTHVNAPITDGAPMYMRVKRTGDQWIQSYSYDGASWDTAATFDHIMTVTAVGPYIGNSGDSPPAHVGLIDYFFNTSSPIVPEDIAAPIITSVPVTGGVLGQPYSYDVVALGSPVPTFALVTSPAGMTINPVSGLIEWTPAAMGDYDVSIEALNTQGADTQSFAITVVGIPPIITTTPPTDGQVYVLYSYDVDATGGPPPTYTLTIFPAGMTIDAASGLIEWTPDDIGDYDVTVEANNAEGTDPQSFTVSVTGIAPTITSTPVIDVVADQAYVYDVEAEGAPHPTFSLTTAPDGMTVNDTTGLIQWLPHVVGDFDVTVAVGNSVDTVEQSFTISVTGFPPEITSSPVTSAHLGQNYTYDVNAIGAPTPVYALITAPGGMTINSTTGVIQWTTSALGDYSIVVEASNSQGADSQSYTLSVSGIPPAFVSEPVTSATVYEPYVYDADANGDPPSAYVLVSGSPEGMTVNSVTGLVQWMPTDIGDFDVSIRAGNIIGVAFQNYTINVAGTPPFITSTPITAVTVGEPYSYDVEATGAPAPTFELTEYPDEMAIDPATGLVTWTPDEGGDYNVTVLAGNTVGVDTQSFVLSAVLVPTIISTPPTDGFLDEVYSYDMEAAGSPAPTFSLLELPDGMTIDPGTGIIEWIPADIGDFDVVAEAVNTQGADTQAFVIHVTEIITPTVHVAAPESGIVCYNYLPELTIEFNDNHGLDHALYQINDCNGSWLPLWSDNANGPDTTVNWMMPDLPDGDHTIFFKVIDDAGNTNADTCDYYWSFTRLQGCCIDVVGNVSNDPEQVIDNDDLIALIDYLFISFIPPECIEEANVDRDPTGMVDLSDLTVLIGYLFIPPHTPPGPCLY